MLFASGEPLEASRIADALELKTDDVYAYLDEISSSLDSSGSGICLLKLGGKYQMCSRKKYAPQVRAVLEIKKNIPLSNAALEVLAVVAYNQPVTKAYIEQVRGVDCSGVVSTLCQKGLLEERGRLDLPGRPLLYGTTPNFLRCFCLTTLADLPELPEKPEIMQLGEQDDEIDSAQGEQIRSFFQEEIDEGVRTEDEKAAKIMPDENN